MNNNILISHLHYYGVYQYEYDNLDIYEEIKIFFGCNPNKKTHKLRCMLLMQ